MTYLNRLRLRQVKNCIINNTRFSNITLFHIVLMLYMNFFDRKSWLFLLMRWYTLTYKLIMLLIVQKIKSKYWIYKKKNQIYKICTKTARLFCNILRINWKFKRNLQLIVNRDWSNRERNFLKFNFRSKLIINIYRFYRLFANYVLYNWNWFNSKCRL